jgi:hypothetical protein
MATFEDPTGPAGVRVWGTLAQIQGFFGPRVPVGNIEGRIMGIDHFGGKDLQTRWILLVMSMILIEFFGWYVRCSTLGYFVQGCRRVGCLGYTACVCLCFSLIVVSTGK